MSQIALAASTAKARNFVARFRLAASKDAVLNGC